MTNEKWTMENNPMIISSSERALQQAPKIIKQGGVIAFRTDTFYGLGSDPFNPAAVARVRELKGREENKPILLLISDESQVDRFFLERPQAFDDVVKRFWPGPLTVIGIAREGVSEELTAGTRSIGLRLPNDEDLRRLVRDCGGALTATSANPSGLDAARSAKEVEQYFPAGIDLIIDSGEVSATKPSAVLDLSGKQPHIVREGAIAASDLKSCLESFKQ